MTAGGLTDTFDVKDGRGHFLVPPPQQRFELVFSAASRGLDATLLVQAVAADGTPLAADGAASTPASRRRSSCSSART